MTMERICKTCALYPKSHSFRELIQENKIHYFYTKPADSILYYDTNGILSHYENVMKSIHGERWSWIFDMKEFSVKHLLQPILCYKLASLIGRYNDSLETIWIINPNTYLSHLLFLVMPFLPTSMREKIKTVKDNKELPDFIQTCLP
jgi:hypothetical protein